MFVQVFPLEDSATTNPLIAYREGTHILGRGDALKCNDKRISRNHARLVVTTDYIELSSIHINPCFLRTASSKTITILSKDSTTRLHDGDCFSFLPDIYWFKLKVVSNIEVEHKRQLEGGEEVPEKRQKFEEDISIEEQREINGPASLNMGVGEGGNEAEVSRSPDNEQNNSVENYNNLDDTLHSNLSLNLDVKEKSNSQSDNDGHHVATNDKEEIQNQNQAPASNLDDKFNSNLSLNSDVHDVRPAATEDLQNHSQTNDPGPINIQEEPRRQNSQINDAPGPSEPKPHRERCWYGAGCYRKNDLHRQDYCHPGDSDYESDADDQRPICQYGAACYRKNKSHRRDFKHPPRDRPNNKPKKRARKKVDRLNAANSEELRELDFSDSEDPFMADDDSDDYKEETDDDSDWEDSQQAEEDSENIKRLVKEAEKFVQK